MSSWYDAWADRYDELRTPQRDADVPFYVKLAREADGPLVELAVGTGRVAIPVAQATGKQVIGIDSSPGMLARAGRHVDPAPGLPVPHTIHHSVSDNRVDIALDDGGTGSLWWATKNEWLGLLDVAGFRLEALYGGFAGEPLAEDSREYVFVARH